MGRMLGLSDTIIKELLVVDVQMCVLGALAIICFLVAASTLKWMGRDYLREAIQRDGWIVTVAANPSNYRDGFRRLSHSDVGLWNIFLRRPKKR